MSNVEPGYTAGAPPDEIAAVIVDGLRFDDWEVVYVQQRWVEPFGVFRFQATERDPLPDLWARLQFQPGQKVNIYLGGELGMVGVIIERQVGYDESSHGVQLSGFGYQWWAARASIIDKTMNFDNMSFEEVANKVLAPFNVGPVVIGTLDPTKFKQLQAQPGETVFSFLERIARPRGVVIGSDEKGNILLIGDHDMPNAADLVEGVNIKKMQFVWTIENTRSDFRVRAQSGATDEHNGKDANEQEAGVPGTAPVYSPLLTPSEQPVWNLQEVLTRAQNEAVWNEGTKLSATVVVEGWKRTGPGGRLWRPGDPVRLFSPMCMSNGFQFKIATATFTQDSESGSTTTLEIVAPQLLKQRLNLNPGPATLDGSTTAPPADQPLPGSPQGDQGSVNTAPAESPPAAGQQDPSTPPTFLPDNPNAASGGGSSGGGTGGGGTGGF